MNEPRLIHDQAASKKINGVKQGQCWSIVLSDDAGNRPKWTHTPRPPVTNKHHFFGVYVQELTFLKMIIN